MTTLIRDARPADGPALFDIWAEAVDATHAFLTPEDRLHIAELVRDEYIPNAKLQVGEVEGEPAGFLGARLDGDWIIVDSLFVRPRHFRKGVGGALLEHVARPGQPVKLDVNEGNPGALAFYQRLGFVQTGRSETDDDGRPYPLLHLERATTGGGV